MLLAVAAALSACAGRHHTFLTEHEYEFLDRIDSVETSFRVPADVSDIVWERARHFIESYSWTATELVGDNVIRTERPRLHTDQCGYQVHRTRVGEEAEFVIECVSGTATHRATAERNSRLLAHYMGTGELPADPERLIWRAFEYPTEEPLCTIAAAPVASNQPMTPTDGNRVSISRR